MEQQSRWQKILIFTVVALTCYNILPTVFFYSNPLDKPIGPKEAQKVYSSISDRFNALEEDSLEWIKNFCSLLQLSPTSIQIEQEQPEWIRVSFANSLDTKKFFTEFSKSGSLIPFLPARLFSVSPNYNEGETSVLVQRMMPISFSEDNLSKFFSFCKKFEENRPTDAYVNLISNRIRALGLSICQNNTVMGNLLNALKKDQLQEETIFSLIHQVIHLEKIFAEHPKILVRCLTNLFQQESSNKTITIDRLFQNLHKLQDQYTIKKIEIEKYLTDKVEPTVNKNNLLLIQKKIAAIQSAISILKKYEFALFATSSKISNSYMEQLLAPLKDPTRDALSKIDVSNYHPLIASLSMDWENESIHIKLHSDIETLYNAESNLERKERLHQLIYDEIARITRETNENITSNEEKFHINLNKLTNSQSIIVFHIEEAAKSFAALTKKTIEDHWNPKHPKLHPNIFPIWDIETYLSLPTTENRLGLLIYTPILCQESLHEKDINFKNNSFYIFAKGINQLVQTVQTEESEQSLNLLLNDLKNLSKLLSHHGYYSNLETPSKNVVFEKENYQIPFLAATREDFYTIGNSQYAILECTDLRQRLLKQNQIETEMHENLLRMQDDYNISTILPNRNKNYIIPKPTKNTLINNFLLSWKKYFRGDERKILHWGLDLSGGKTVQIALRDTNGQNVTNPSDIEQSIHELYTRLNKLGMSEVAIRQEGSLITLDFPHAQGISANDLIQASTMRFHVVNEKFSTHNPDLAIYVEKFLQEIWNEALITEKKDPINLNQIAYKHLYGLEGASLNNPLSESARILYEAGLRIAEPSETSTSFYNDKLSTIASFRQDSSLKSKQNGHPLLIVFKNYSLEGKNIKNVTTSYDPTKGHFLSFEVKNIQKNGAENPLYPRKHLNIWTNAFAQDKILGTELERYSQGRGWRMAVLFNDYIISAPNLESTLSDRISITGNFSQREIHKLESDLKAGSLSFIPQILSEKNVSPELGIKERSQGLFAAGLALLLVMSVMIIYYRFAGLVAAIAVFFNLLIIWAILQNLQATLTLSSIAGIILTMGMAVDANVLVFERIKEEFSLSKCLTSALKAGYTKAYSAILDSNLTTIIAAVILLQFDSGPIKGFAITLIVGIVSSMFTALFMTKYFFSEWIKNKKNIFLKMSNWIPKTKIPFLIFTKRCLFISAIVLAVGIVSFFLSRHSMFGMDFTGGFACTIELQSDKPNGYRQAVESAFIKAGIPAQSIQVRELTPSNHLRIFFAKTLENHPVFSNLQLSGTKNIIYLYEENAKLDWIVKTLESNGLQVLAKSKQTLDTTWVNVTGQMSSTMKNHAILGLSLALICIMFYISMRFEWIYAIAATCGLAYDLIFTLAIISFLHLLNVPLQIDLHTIAALMTIIGYSLNDTIIIFDRIREEMKTRGQLSFKEVIVDALNSTLSRTLMTSITTLIALLGLVIFGGATIFSFAFVMTIGVLIGTFSSLFIAVPCLAFLHARISKNTFVLSAKQHIERQ